MTVNEKGSLVMKHLPERCGDIISRDSMLAILETVEPDKRYPMNDLGYGRLFAGIFKDSARYNTTAKSWYVYDGRVWVEDTESMAVHGYAKTLCDALVMYASRIEEEAAKQAFLKWVGRYAMLNKRETMIRDARAENYFSKDEMDKDIYLFNCQNGTFDLDSMKFREHRPSDLLSKISNVHYEPGARSERWESFMEEVLEGDKDKIKYLQKILGYSMTGLTEIEQFFILYGKYTRNGKSTTMETYAHMLGNDKGYAITITPETLAVKVNKDSRCHSTDIARLRGARFVNAAEPKSRMLLDAALIKGWTGNDTISAREIFEKQMEFRPMFKLFMNTNHLPVIGDDSIFASRRVNLINFDRKFEEHEQDLKLKGKLQGRENISGLFNWCLEGLKEYRLEGLKPPPSVVAATKEYRNSQDKIQQFIDECLVETGGGHEKAGDVYMTYSGWCRDCNMAALNKSNFYDEMKTKGMFANTATIDKKTVKNVILNHKLSGSGDVATVREITENDGLY
jgi:putative DNA primase/helicase